MSRMKVANTKEQNNAVIENGTPKDKKMLIFVCIFVSVVLLAGIIFGTVFAIRNANSVLDYNGARMSEGVANYFASYAKSYYLNVTLGDVPGAEDTPEFWNSPQRGTTTYREGLEEYVLEYLRMIVVGCYLYDSVAKLSADAKETVKKNVEARVLYLADSKRGFNETVKKYGFDYDDFYEATEMMYKVTMASYMLYGSDGANLKSNTEIVNEFYNAAYRRVRLLFIRTESDFNLIEDENGNLVRQKNDDGTDMLIPLTDAEKERANDDIESIKNAIENDMMSEDSFDYYLGVDKYYATNMYLDPNGEYYSAESEYTLRAYEEFPDVVSAALYMGKGTYTSVEIQDVGVCFIYRGELEYGAYTDSSEDGPFSDFYSDLISYTYKKELDGRYTDVKIRDKFYGIDLVALPINGTYTIGL